MIRDDKSDPMDLAALSRLAELMDAHDVVELEIDEGDRRVALRKTAAAGHACAPMPAAFEGAVLPGDTLYTEGRARERVGGHIVASPLTGTFYRASGPGAAAFVEIGDHVQSNTVMCIVEAMKVMNEVRADVSGVVREILAKDGKPVEHGQTLFVVGS